MYFFEFTLTNVPRKGFAITSVNTRQSAKIKSTRRLRGSMRKSEMTWTCRDVTTSEPAQLIHGRVFWRRGVVP